MLTTSRWRSRDPKGETTKSQRLTHARVPGVPFHQVVFEHSGRRLIGSLIIGEGQPSPRLVLREAICRMEALAEVIGSPSQRENEMPTW